MKNKKMMIKRIRNVVLLCSMLFVMSVGLTACGSEVGENEAKERKTTEEVTEVTTEATTAATTEEVTTEATTEAKKEEEGTASKTDASAGQDYLVKSFTFADDGTSGDFVLESFDAYDNDFVASIQPGDKLDNGYEIESVEEDDSIYWLNSQGGDSVYYLELQENGKYYLFDDAGFAATSEVGEKTFPISKDVVIVDDFSPFGKNGINYSESEVKIYNTIDDLKAQLESENAWYTPELFIRVEGGEITFISVNPWQHEPWGDF